MATLSGHTDGVVALAALDGNRVASGGQDDTIKVWDVSARGHFNCVATLQSENKLVRALAALQGRSVSSDFLASGFVDNSISLYIES